MNRTALSLVIGIIGACIALGGKAQAQTVQTIGAGSAVTTVDRATTFAPINTNGISLSDWVENGLFIGVSGDSWIGDGVTDFDPFHGANGTDRTFHFPYGGSLDSVVIRTTDGMKIYALELMYGNGWTTGDIYGQYPWGNHDAQLEWQTWRNTVMVSSGIVGASPILEMGTIVGFSDTTGFDELILRCTIATSWDPRVQALALDNLNVQLSSDPGAGTVDKGAGGVGPVDVLKINGGGGGLGRVVELHPSDPLLLAIEEPPSRVGLRASYAVYAWLGDPVAASATVLPRGIGTTCMPTPITPASSPHPAKIANNIGATSQLGVENWPGRATQRAPYNLLNLPSGVGLSHVGLHLFFQGIIQDDRSAGTVRFSVTNGLILRIIP